MGYVPWWPLLELILFDTLSCSQVTAARCQERALVDEIYKCPIFNKLLLLDLKIGHQDSSFSNVHQGYILYCVHVFALGIKGSMVIVYVCTMVMIRLFIYECPMN